MCITFASSWKESEKGESALISALVLVLPRLIKPLKRVKLNHLLGRVQKPADCDNCFV